MNHPCPHCPKTPQMDYYKYGFNLVRGCNYWTIIPEVKACCPIKVTVTDYTNAEVTVTFNGKTYTKSRKDFMESSWRDIDAY